MRLLRWRKAFVAVVIASASTNACFASMYDVGVDLYNKRDFRAAAIQFELHAKAHPEDSRALYYAGLSYHQMGDYKKAKLFYQQACAAGPNTQAGLMAKAWLAKIGNAESSSRSASQAQQRSTSSIMPTSRYIESTDYTSLPRDAQIYYTTERGQMNVSAFINGRPIPMVFDTGAPLITVGRKQLEDIGLQPPKGPPHGKTGGSSNSAPVNYWIMFGDVKVGTIERKNAKIEVVEENASEALLGQNFFQDFSYTIDQGARCIRFARRSMQQPSAIATNSSYATRDPLAVPFVWEPAGNRIVVLTEVNSRNVEMIFDTGNSSSAVSFCSLDDLKKANLKLPEDARETRAVGISGSGAAYAFPVSKIKLGPIERLNVDVDVNKDGASERPLLGQQFWAGWEYTIDMDKKLIHFKRR